MPGSRLGGRAVGAGRWVQAVFSGGCREGASFRSAFVALRVRCSHVWWREGSGGGVGVGVGVGRW